MSFFSFIVVFNREIITSCPLSSTSTYNGAIKSTRSVSITLIFKNFLTRITYFFFQYRVLNERYYATHFHLYVWIVGLWLWSGRCLPAIYSNGRLGRYRWRSARSTWRFGMTAPAPGKSSLTMGSWWFAVLLYLNYSLHLFTIHSWASQAFKQKENQYETQNEFTKDFDGKVARGC